MSEPVSRLLRDQAALEGEFRRARPFGHVVVDGFLEEELCAGLAREFRCDLQDCDESAYSGLGTRGREDVLSQGASYRRLDELLRDPRLIGALSAIAGAPRLMYDWDYAGRGPSEHHHGKGLVPHVDYNRHPATGWLRALNLVLYLNADWKADWGGQLDLYEPRGGANAPSPSRSIEPSMNRLVVFAPEGWHGVRRVRLPEEKRGLSRRAFLVSYWQDERSAPRHGTLWGS